MCIGVLVYYIYNTLVQNTCQVPIFTINFHITKIILIYPPRQAACIKINLWHLVHSHTNQSDPNSAVAPEFHQPCAIGFPTMEAVCTALGCQPGGLLEQISSGATMPVSNPTAREWVSSFCCQGNLQLNPYYKIKKWLRKVQHSKQSNFDSPLIFIMTNSIFSM